MKDENIEAIWQSLPTIDIFNEASRSGLKTEYAMRIAFARAIIASMNKSEPSTKDDEKCPICQSQAITFYRTCRDCGTDYAKADDIDKNAALVSGITDLAARDLIEFIYQRIGFVDRDLLIAQVQRILIAGMNKSYSAGVKDIAETMEVKGFST